MSSTLILIGLLLSLSMAVILPEIQISKNQNSYAYIISPEYDSMVNRQRRGYLVLGLLAVSTFFVSIQTMSVPLFIFHLVLDCVFGIYAFLSFQVRRSMQVQNNLTMGTYWINPSWKSYGFVNMIIIQLTTIMCSNSHL